MSRFFNIVRTAVSGDKYRYIDDEYNLDLTYITDNIIAMALPAEGVEATYRNNIHEVSKFLDSKHAGHYMILNLSERKYNYDLFHNQVLEFPFPDHHNPPLGLLFECCNAIDAWLKADPKNVVAAHCLAGRGRTGTVIACALNFLGMFSTATDALNFFAQKRSEIARGVLNPSQRRYVEYFTHVLQGSVDPTPKLFFLRRVLLTSIPRMDGTSIFRPSLHLSVCRKLVYSSVSPQNPEIDDLSNYPTYKSKLWSGSKQTRKPSSVHIASVHLPPGNNQARRSTSSSMVVAGEATATTATFFTPIYSNIVVFNVNALVSGDVLLRCNHHYKSITKQPKSTQSFRLGFHTTFLKTGTITVPRTHIDGPHKDINCKKFDGNFAVQIVLEEPTEEQKKSHLDLNPQEFGVPDLSGTFHKQATLTAMAQNSINSRDRRSVTPETSTNQSNHRDNRVTVSLDGKGFFPTKQKSATPDLPIRSSSQIYSASSASGSTGQRRVINPPKSSVRYLAANGSPKSQSMNPSLYTANSNQKQNTSQNKSAILPSSNLSQNQIQNKNITPTNQPSKLNSSLNRPLPNPPNEELFYSDDDPDHAATIVFGTGSESDSAAEFVDIDSSPAISANTLKNNTPNSSVATLLISPNAPTPPSSSTDSSRTKPKSTSRSSAELFRECSMSLDQQQDLVAENTRLTSRVGELLTEINYYQNENARLAAKNKTLEAKLNAANN